MNELVRRGLSAYRIFLKDKLMSSVMMLVFGIMMLVAALNGNGNDTWTLPIIITALGSALALWSAYRFGYLKSSYDEDKQEPRAQKIVRRKELTSQALESIIYTIVAGLGVFLLVNQDFTNQVLNLMAGSFTVLNGIFGVISTFKNRETKDFRWKFIIVLTVFELILGSYFIISSRELSINSYIIMGTLTTIAGIAEIISASTKHGLSEAVDDGRKIIQTMKKDRQ